MGCFGAPLTGDTTYPREGTETFLALLGMVEIL